MRSMGFVINLPLSFRAVYTPQFLGDAHPRNGNRSIIHFKSHIREEDY
jgi:hypothetical protein